MPFNPAIPILETYPKAVVTEVSKDLVSRMFIGILVLFTMALFIINVSSRDLVN